LPLGFISGILHFKWHPIIRVCYIDIDRDNLQGNPGAGCVFAEQGCAEHTSRENGN
jgi:hypothetical protein